jgi:hypothetical protein
LRGRGEQGDMRTNGIARAALYRPPIETRAEIGRHRVHKINSPSAKSGTIQGPDNGGTWANGIVLFTKAPQARQRSIGSDLYRGASITDH